MATYGELSTYDPTLHAGKFLLPLHRDQNTDQPIETGYAPIGTMLTGVNYGMQFPPVIGAQALVLFLDGNLHLPVAAVLFATAIEYPPFTDAKSRGWKDAKANAVKTTDDGPTPGDGVGGARIVGAGYASVVAPKVELAGEGLTAGKAVMTQDDAQTLANSIISKVQTAINTLAAECAGGTGVSAPTVAAVTAAGSTKVKAAD